MSASVKNAAIVALYPIDFVVPKLGANSSSNLVMK
jgi:hypothetical protein